MQPAHFRDFENILPSDGEAYYFPAFFPRETADQFLSLLIKQVPWKQESIRLFGKQVMQPRLTAYYGDVNRPYSYSGITMYPLPWVEPLCSIKEKVEAASGTKFTAALLNQYRNGADSMGWHRDNEKSLGRDPVIASVSFGGPRKFSLRHFINKKLLRTLDLEHGSLLLMQGSTQHYWEHQLPRTSQHKDVRVNITFRVVGS